MAGEEFSLPLRVYIEDTDAGGIVYYVNYLKFMERARTELMRSLGFGKDYIFTHDLMFVVRDVAVKYLKPAQLDDQLRVTAVITMLGGASMTMEQAIRRDNEVLARGQVTIACVERAGVRPRRLPEDMRERLAPLAR
ncbi:tol-pal system-associated acyl-CoA thioesterase [Pseudohalioglobus lutimaris]|uniref:Tol-pal system-associated acyl-CoA thioesterase n=1 Tax=Pseudohalioglobus lutimaris TaxID=1737061 RepID=A0A2N5X0G5_9GAMM|nr:tol-pal system-associated acyl-CoA thioesterase [Pseudohalioglobus lutimaris]PLW67989.1 tol-pal system-associated acyl-CoA thioesterase [Pseudohalioglobus lutimaris]